MATSYHAQIVKGDVVVTAMTEHGEQSAPTAAEAARGLKGHRASRKDEQAQADAEGKARQLREAVKLLGPSLSLPVGGLLFLTVDRRSVYLVKDRTALLLDDCVDVEEAAHCAMRWRETLRSMP